VQPVQVLRASESRAQHGGTKQGHPGTWLSTGKAQRAHARVTTLFATSLRRHPGSAARQSLVHASPCQQCTNAWRAAALACLRRDMATQGGDISKRSMRPRLSAGSDASRRQNCLHALTCVHSGVLDALSRLPLLHPQSRMEHAGSWMANGEIHWRNRSALVQARAVYAHCEGHGAAREQPLHHLRVQHGQHGWDALARNEGLMQVPCGPSSLLVAASRSCMQYSAWTGATPILCRAHLAPVQSLGADARR
jgi:hypothetical protein